jgi:predicted transcriptional regulator
MTTKILEEAKQRVKSRPQEAQEEHAEIAFEIDARLKGGKYHATPEELAGIDRGLEAAREGRFATDTDVEAVFAKRSSVP